MGRPGNVAAPRGGAAPARQRILAGADVLFYAQGARAVGVDQLVAQADVSLATFYHHFPSKAQLFDDYLEARSVRARALMEALRDAHPGDPLAALRAIAAGVVAEGHTPGYRGCEFVNAVAEFGAAGTSAGVLARDYRAWIRRLLAELLRLAGRPGPEVLAEQLLMLRTGQVFARSIDGSAGADAAFLAAWDRLIDSSS